MFSFFLLRPYPLLLKPVLAQHCGPRPHGSGRILPHHNGGKCRPVLLRHCGDGKHVSAGIATDTKLVRSGHKAEIDIDYITSLPVSSCPSPQGFSVANFKTRSSSAVVTGSTVATFLISVTAAFKLTGEMRTLPSKCSGTNLQLEDPIVSCQHGLTHNFGTRKPS